MFAEMIQVIRSITPVKWKPVEGFPGYYVSNNGLVRHNLSLLKQKLSKGRIDYLYVHVNNQETNQSHRKHIHRLVWDHFSSQPHIPGYEIHHKDENPNNNHIDNLELIPMLVHKKIHKESKANKRKAA